MSSDDENNFISKIFNNFGDNINNYNNVTLKCSKNKKCLKYLEKNKQNLECNICYEVNEKHNNCDKCEFITCIECILKIDKDVCINCNNNLSLSCFKYIHKISNIYKKHYIKKYIQIYKDYSNIIILRYINHKNLKQNVYITELDTYQVLSICKKNNCIGNINQDYVCLHCNTKYCIKCEEPIEFEHICNEIILSNLEYLKQNTKKCPICFTYIEKIPESCNDMKCVSCGSYFNWRNLFIDTKQNTNDHYNNLNNIKYKDLYEKYLENYEKTALNKYSTKSLISNKKNVKKLYTNYKNKYSKLFKQKIKYEYLYFSNINMPSDEIINKLYDIYQNIEYFHNLYKIMIKHLPPYILSNKINALYYNNFFMDHKKMYKLDSNCKIIKKTISTKKPKIFKFFGNFLTNNSINIKIYENLIKHNICSISSYCNREEIIQTLIKLLVKKIVIIGSTLLSYTWLEIAQKYNIEILYIYKQDLKKIFYNDNFVITSQNISVFNHKIYEFINNSTLIIDNHCCEKNKFLDMIMNYYFDNKFYIINIFCISQEYFEKKIISFYIKNKNHIINYINKLPKETIINTVVEYYVKNHNNMQLTSYNKIFVNNNSSYIIINKTIFDNIHENDHYINNSYKFEPYLINKSPNYNIYRINKIFYIYMFCCNKFIIHNHERCINICLYCKECCQNTKQLINKTDISMCCYVHSLPYINDPMFPDAKEVLQKLKYKFTNYEINLIFYFGEKYFLSIFAKNLINNIKIREEKHMMKIVPIYDSNIIEYKSYNISDHMYKNILSVYLLIKDHLIHEYVNLDNLLNFITNNINNNNFCIKKFIFPIIFNQNIDHLRNLYKHCKNMLFIHKKTTMKQRYNIIKKFATEDKYNILILSPNIDIPIYPINKNYIIDIVVLNLYNIYFIITNLLVLLNNSQYVVKIYDMKPMNQIKENNEAN